MDTITFSVQGSEPKPYSVKFSEDGKMRCTCRAGVMNVLCKHRLDLLNGDVTALVSGNSDLLPLAVGWIMGNHKANLAVKELNSLIQEEEDIKSRIKKQKKLVLQYLT